MATDHAEYLEATNSVTEEVTTRIASATPADVDRAVRAAQAAQPGWASWPRDERIAVLERAADVLRDTAEEAAVTVTAEVGTPIAFSRIAQVGSALQTLDTLRDYARDVPEALVVEGSPVHREPVGVVGAITPWNYPLDQAVTKVAPALAAGCAVVLKPSELAPTSVQLLEPALTQAGCPAGVITVLYGAGATGRLLAEHAGLDAVTFTGSTAVGRQVYLAAAANLNRAQLELGGKSAFVVLDDADLERAMAHGVDRCFMNNGQTCSALTRMLVPRARLGEVEETLAALVDDQVVGDPQDPSVTVGPLVSGLQRDRVLAHIRNAEDSGARLVAGGSRAAVPDRGYFVAPTVFSRVDNASDLAQQEVFGPVLAVVGYDDDDDAVRLANDSPYGLAAGVFSSDGARAESIGRRLRVGSVEINEGRYNGLAPFGGFKQSGIGRERGRFGLEEWYELKTLYV